MKRLFALPVILLIASCSTTKPYCPEPELPEVVKIQVPTPVLLPVPRPPVYLDPVTLGDAYHNFLEAFLAEQACRAVILENNEAVE